MYHVFTEDEIKLWRDWIWELGEQEKKRSGAEFAALKDSFERDRSPAR